MASTIGIDAKLRRAREHLYELNIEAARFALSDPYVECTYCDVERRQFVAKVNVDPTVDSTRLSTILGDMFGNLRSALDFAIHELTGHQGTGHIYFPTSKTASDFRGHVRGLKHLMPKHARGSATVLREIEAYPTGKGEAIWELHELNNLNKHRLLILAGAAQTSIRLHIGKFAALHFSADSASNITQEMQAQILGMGIADARTTGKFPIEDGTELFRGLIGTPDEQMEVYCGSTLQIAFGEGQVFRGEPLFPTAENLVDLVDEIIDSLRPYLD